MFLLLVAAVLLAFFARRFRAEPRRLSNSVLLFLGLGLGLLGVLRLASPSLAGFVLVLMPPLLALGLAVTLVLNGVTMLRRERFRPANMLSLFAGLAMIGLAVATVVSFFAAHQARNLWVVVPALCALFAAAYIGFVFALVVLYAVAYARILPRSEGHAGIVVLGAGVPHGRVPPLLAGRLDRAVELYRRERAAGLSPLLIPSGGQGADEPVAEATAMADYLRDKGIDDDAIMPEDRSTTTRENLLFSKKLLEDRGTRGTLLVVTSSYHVLRAAVQSRRLRVDAEVRGAKTAWYYVPNAFLREFVALLADHKLLHTAGVLVSVACPVLLNLANG